MENKSEKHNDRLVFIVDRFNAVESNISEIIAYEIGAPKEKSEFIKSVLLNNAIMPFSNKVKLFLHLRALNDWPKVEQDRFHRLMHIRNQFAHCIPKYNVHICMDNKKEVAKITEFLMLESVTNAGKIEPTDSDTAFQQFKECYIYIRDYFSKLYEIRKDTKA